MLAVRKMPKWLLSLFRSRSVTAKRVAVRHLRGQLGAQHGVGAAAAAQAVAENDDWVRPVLSVYRRLLHIDNRHSSLPEAETHLCH